MDRWARNLQKAIGKNGTRPELKENLEAVIAQNKDEIEAFADDNIKIEYTNLLRINSFIWREVDPKLIAYYFSAVYFANARYFQRDIKKDVEKIDISVSRAIDQSEIQETGLHTHLVKISSSRFVEMYFLLRSIDAESRHMVHQNLHNDLGVMQMDLAVRASLVMGEVLDHGRPYHDGHKVSPQIDPFLNDFSIFGEKDGHNAAYYMDEHLASDSKAKWMQLFWLSRLMGRLKSEESEARVLELAIRDLGRKMGESEEMRTVEYFKAYSRGFNPYEFGIVPLVSFYYGNKPVGFFEEGLAAIRSHAIRHFSYEVSNGEGVVLNGRRITKFASQLDFVALKLITSKPVELYAEAGGK